MNAIVLLLAVMLVPAAYAHTTVEVGPYEIEVGWGTEPPVEGQANRITYSISEGAGSEGVRSGVAGALSDVDVALRFGGIEKSADVLVDPRPGDYYTKIIPTRTGTYHIAMSGQIGDTILDEVIPIEDVEGTAILDFPPRSGGDADVAALQNAVTAMQRELDSVGSDAGSYDIALFAAAFGIAGLILAVIAMIKR